MIPARGGSKRIPRKNIRPFCGKPMIAYSIEAARDSGCFDHVIVSTDDEEVADLARHYGAETPFRRPDALADDQTSTRPVIIHAIREMAERLGNMADSVCCIYATAPFLTGSVLADACNRLESSNADFVFSCAAYAYPIQRAFRLLPNGGAEWLWPQHKQARSQDLEAAFHDAGQFYWGRARAFLDGHDTVSVTARPFVLPPHRVQDIDTPDDWLRAESLFRALSLMDEAPAA